MSSTTHAGDQGLIADEEDLDDAQRNKLRLARQLLAKAEDEGVTPAEAEALTAKAAALLAQYGIDRALAWAADPAAAADPEHRLFDIEYPFALSRAHLLHGIARALNCDTVRVTLPGDARHRKNYQMDVFGFPPDLDRVDLLFTSLALQASVAMYWDPVPPGRDPAAFHDSWLMGWANGIYHRLSAAEDAASGSADAASTPGAPGAVMVLADRFVIVQQLKVQVWPDLVKNKPRKLSGGGRRLGWQAAQRANIHDAAHVETGKRDGIPS